MNSPQLVRHPAPHPTECLHGYVLRLSELNGYASPRHLYHLAEMKPTEISPTSFALTKLATVTNQPQSRLQRIAVSPKGGDSREFYVLGKRVGIAYLNLTGARVCPECVAEKGYIEAHWHIDLMVACPIHERTAVWFCGKCRSRLSWNRPGLLTCKCGAPLSIYLREKYSETELWLLDLIRQKALGAVPHRPVDASLPGAQLATTTLQSLLSLIRVLGEQRLKACRSSNRPLGRDLLRAAASLFEKWPLNLQRHLRNISPHPSDDQSFSLSLDALSIQQAISERFALRRQKTQSTLKKEADTPRPTDHHQLSSKPHIVASSDLGTNAGPERCASTKSQQHTHPVRPQMDCDGE